MGQPRVLLLTHDDMVVGGREQRSIIDALRVACDLDVRTVNAGWPASWTDLRPEGHYDACVFFVRFRFLLGRPPFDWQGFAGIRVLYEWDACQNYATLDLRAYEGQWPGVVERDRFDWLVVTGGDIARRFQEEGCPAYWLPKAADGIAHRDLGLPRSGLATYGYRYPARTQAMRRLRRESVPIERFRCLYEDLGEHLNRYEACLVHDRAWETWPVIGRYLVNRVPRLSGRSRPGVEALIKNFEAPACGCLALMDPVPDLDELGFVHGRTALVYDGADAMVDLARDVVEHPGRYEDVRQAGRDHVHGHHTWAHRAEALAAWIVHGAPTGAVGWTLPEPAISVPPPANPGD